MHKLPEIDKVLYYEGADYTNIYKFMNDNIGQCDVLLTFCSQNANKSKYVQIEWQAALSKDKIIIPIFIDMIHIPALLTPILGVQFKQDELSETINEIYKVILKSTGKDLKKYLMKKYSFFVAYDFERTESEDLIDTIERVFKDTVFKGYYLGKELKSFSKSILSKIEEMIRQSNFGIFDMTFSNINVAFELGLAKGANKRVYIICKKGTHIAADLIEIDRIEFENYSQLFQEIKNKILVWELEKTKEMNESQTFE